MNQGCSSDNDKDFYHVRQNFWNDTKNSPTALAKVEISHSVACSFLTERADRPGRVARDCVCFAHIVTLTFLFLDRAMEL